MSEKLDLDALERIARVSIAGDEYRRQMLAALDRLRELESASQPGGGEAERAAFVAWMRGCEGYPFAGQFANLMWKAWQARALRAAPSAGNGGAEGDGNAD